MYINTTAVHYIQAPMFDYYCESGVKFCCLDDDLSNETLWDGQQCGGEAFCCTHPNLPWFIKSLNETTTEDIELRLCKKGIHAYYNTDLIEIFVQWKY